MTTPPQGSTQPPEEPRPAEQDGRPQAHPPPLTEDMVIRRRTGPSERVRGLTGRRKQLSEPAPPGDAWTPTVRADPGPLPSLPEPGAGAADGTAGDRGGRVRKGRTGGKGRDRRGRRPAGREGKRKRAPETTDVPGDGEAAGKPGKAPKGRVVSPARKWAGARRAVMARRFLGVLAVLLLFFLAVTVNGKATPADVRAIVDRQAEPEKDTFPDGAAQLWAAPVVKAFATYDAELAEQRSQALAPYAINGLDPQLGWNGSGRQSVLDMVIGRDVQRTGEDRGTVHATVQIQDGSWRCVAVPLYVARREGTTSFGLTGAPVYTSCSGITTPPEREGGADNDTELAETFATELLPPFMAAWQQGDKTNLKRYLLPGVASFGLGGAFTGSGTGGRPTVEDVFVPVPEKGGSGDRRTVTFTVTMLGLDGESAQTSRYSVAAQRKDGQWYFAGDPTPPVGGTVGGGGGVPEVRPTEGPADLFSPSQSPTAAPEGNPAD
ncbi:conjugal transfer protein [Streptomyces chumphonensis]|uniref:conjugal transfer protein n=1 Tax=Streptomyces chumphonensis TaxID=1214925 RepID=UPI003D72F3A4